ncbi:hypothetical protein K0U91_01225 [Chryseobacterium chendengshani]|uniref:hypothetical protein n=1 Tax=Chryseobacterium sp. LJ668 TaxID=2864040 RepID=UPI001C687642|nr:hypothetical protein [Chryseobacterium sp. LJ668]MBW8523846.1 hypothetical protein [Chryseobacterium sp. LJ668]QYK16789.1 hypothetical protein K0U91_01225 [Chryseobacterium sp. LJ668]
MKKFIPEFNDKTIDKIKLLIPEPYWAVGDNLSFNLSKDILPEEGRFEFFFYQNSFPCLS